MQKFQRGNLIRVVDNLGASMSHFDGASEEAIVIGSYRDQFGGGEERNPEPVYTLLFDEHGEASWYYERQLTLIDEGGEHLIEALKARREERNKIVGSLEYIVANWKDMREHPPGATMAYLMRRAGITEPWGSQGEGLAYYHNLRQTFSALDEALLSGDIATVEARIKKVSPLRTIDVRIGDHL